MNANLSAADVALTLIDCPPPEPPPPPIQLDAEPFRPSPVHCLPQRVACLVSAVAGATGTESAWAALAAMVTLAGCIGNRAAVVLKRGWVEPAILWGALIGKSGTVKSVVLRHVTRPVVELLKKARDEFCKALEAHNAELERYGIALREWRAQQKSGPPTAPPAMPKPPREQRILVADITIEKLGALLGENPLGLLVVRDELAGLVNSFDRYAGGKGSDLQAWLSMNDAGPLLIDRKVDGSNFVERATVSVLGTIQPHTLRSVFGVAEREAGLLARLIMTFPPDRPALWTDEELPDAVAKDWQELLASLTALGPERDESGRPRPKYLGIAKAAKTLFITWHDRHAREVAGLEDDHLRAHWSKLKGMCARIALIFACTEQAPFGQLVPVSAKDMERAIEVTEWLKQESARIYAGLAETAEDRERRKLIEWIARRGRVVTVRDLTHSLAAFRGNSEAARKVLDELVRTGAGYMEFAPPGNGGRPSERFVLTCVLDNANTETTPGAIENVGFGVGVEDEDGE